LSDRAEFLKGYAERILGRPLTDDEAALVAVEVNRRKVRDLCGTFAEKPKAKAKKPKSKVKLDKELEMVVDEVESGSSKGSE
tara:strand:+ start:10405 stop:10650 length:246 start_codon:yes stop_codon:yes gene_type:complete